MADETEKTNGQLQTIGNRAIYRYSSSYTQIEGTEQVKVVHLTKCGDEKLAFHSYTLDLTNVSAKELLENAAKNINIQYIRPRIFRKEKAQTVIDKWDESVVVDAQGIMAQASSRVKDPVVAATNLLSKMTPEQRQEMIKQMEAMG